MNSSERSKFLKLIGDICAFYRRDYSEFTGRIWWESMKPFDYSAVADALNRHCINPDTGQFMPMPADVVKMLQGSTQDSALNAWAKVDRAVRTVGPYRSVVFDDPIIHRVVAEMGGWIHIQSGTDEGWPFAKNEFVNRYRSYRKAGVVPEYNPVLVGIAEAQNSMQGHAVEPPMLIGDQQKAAIVMSMGSDKQLVQITPSKSNQRLLPGQNASFKETT